MEKTLEFALKLVLPEESDVLTTKRKDLKGKVEIVKTTFDHALTALKLYELTEDKTYLRKFKDFFNETSEPAGNFARWNFAPPYVRDIPPDADTTAVSLLFFAMAERNGLEVPQKFLARNNLGQFRIKGKSSKGIETFFGKRRKEDYDPIVNSAIAFLYIIAPTPEAIPGNIVGYLNKEVQNLLKKCKISRYYSNGSYFAERIAKLAFYDPSLLNKESEDSLDKFLLIASPRNGLDASLLSIGSSYRGLRSRARNLNREIERKRKNNGTWPFGTLYRQGTPRYSYGCERLTTLFSIEALELESSGPKKISLK